MDDEVLASIYRREVALFLTLARQSREREDIEERRERWAIMAKKVVAKVRTEALRLLRSLRTAAFGNG